jgi:hypothetical protein
VTTEVDPLLPTLRLYQEMALQLPLTAMASAVDLGDLESPVGANYPRVKIPLGARLVDSAMVLTYAQTGPYLSPKFSMATQIAPTQISLDYMTPTLYGGIVTREVSCPDGMSIFYCDQAGFEVSVNILCCFLSIILITLLAIGLRQWYKPAISGKLVCGSRCGQPQRSDADHHHAHGRVGRPECALCVC